jgi:hypothetical protein
VTEFAVRKIWRRQKILAAKKIGGSEPPSVPDSTDDSSVLIGSDDGRLLLAETCGRTDETKFYKSRNTLIKWDRDIESKAYGDTFLQRRTICRRTGKRL